MGAVIILGGHRTGTSITAQIVHRLGFPAAPEKSRLIVPQPKSIADNPDGYWEDAAFVRIHRRMLSENGRRFGWASPQRNESVIAALQARYRRLIHERCERNPAWCLKDPRLCLLADVLWESLDACGVSFRVVTTERPQHSAAASLQKRGLSFADAVTLAGRFELERQRVVRELGWRGIAIHRVAFDRLTDGVSAEGVVGDLAAFLGVSGSPEIVAAIRPGANHHPAFC